MNAAHVSLAKTLWDFHCIPDAPQTCDLIMGLGSYDLAVADHGVALLQAGWAPRLLFTGNVGNWTADLYGKPEAEAFADRARALGVADDQLIVEPDATHIGENLSFSRRLLAALQIDVSTALVVTKGNTLRRVAATAPIVWPELKVWLSCPASHWDAQPPAGRTMVQLIEEMVGDLHRMLVYPRLGHQVAQTIPEPVRAAYGQLIEAGYDGHLIADQPIGLDG